MAPPPLFKWCLTLSACALLGASLVGCNITRTAARFAGPVLEAGTAAFESEPDVAFAEEAAPSNLKLLEGLLREAPENHDLLLLSCRGYGTYAFGFLEPKLEMARILSPSEVPELSARIAGFYARALEYGKRALPKDLREAMDQDDTTFRAILNKQSKRRVPEIFWTAYAWGALLQIDITDPESLTAVPKINAMMNWVLEKDEGYYFGGAHLFFGALYSQLPPGAGGDPEASRRHFDRARALTEGNLLIVDLFAARYLAVRLQDYPLYKSALEQVLSAPGLEVPEARLANEIAKKRAAFYLENADAFFLDVPAETQPRTGFSPKPSPESFTIEEAM